MFLIHCFSSIDYKTPVKRVLAQIRSTGKMTFVTVSQLQLYIALGSSLN